MLKKSLCIIFSVALIVNVLVRAQTADELIRKNIEARGGYETLKAVNTMKATGKIIQMGMEISFTLRKKRPNFVRLEGELQGQTFIQAYDGETAWWINPFTGDPDAQKMPENQAKSLIDDADFDGQLVDYKEKGHSVEFVGKEDMEGTEVVKLKLTLKNGDVKYIYLDSEYYIELKVTSKTKQGETELEVDAYLSDYKEVNGLMIPHAIESKMGGNTVSQIKLETVEMNVEVDDSIFKMPPKKEKEE